MGVNQVRWAPENCAFSFIYPSLEWDGDMLLLFQDLGFFLKSFTQTNHILAETMGYRG